MSPALDATLTGASLALAAALLLSLLRLARGPTLPDRIVALDLASLIAAGLICVQAIERRSPLLLLAAVVLTLLAFLSTVAFARYIERTKRL